MHNARVLATLEARSTAAAACLASFQPSDTIPAAPSAVTASSAPFRRLLLDGADLETTDRAVAKRLGECEGHRRQVHGFGAGETRREASGSERAKQVDTPMAADHARGGRRMHMRSSSNSSSTRLGRQADSRNIRYVNGVGLTGVGRSAGRWPNGIFFVRAGVSTLSRRRRHRRVQAL